MLKRIVVAITCSMLVQSVSLFAQSGKVPEAGIEPAKVWMGEVSRNGKKEVELPMTGLVNNVFFEGYVGYIDNRADWEKLLKVVMSTEKFPEIDFTKNSLMVSPMTAVRIKIVVRDGDSILDYAIAMPKTKEQEYTIALFTKAQLESVRSPAKSK